MKTATSSTRIAVIEEHIERRDYPGALLLLQEFPPAEASVLSKRDRLYKDVLTAECFAFLGRCRDAVSISKKAARALRSGDDHALYGHACFALAVAHFYMGEVKSAIENCSLATFAFKRTENHESVVRALNWLGIISSYKSAFEHALSSYSNALDIARRHQMRRWVAVLRDNIARTHLLTGDLRKARVSLRGNASIFEAIDDRLNSARNALSVAYLEIQERRLNEAQRRLHALKSRVDSTGSMRDRGVWHEYMGELKLGQENLDEAVTNLEAAIQLSDSEGPDESVIGQSRRLLAEVRLAQGNLDEAAVECDRALISIRKVGERFEEGVVYRVIAEVHARRNQREPAVQAFRKSVDILRTIGARLEWAKTCLAAGRAETFNTRERLAYLFEAERLFADVGVEYWIAETQSALTAILEDKSETHAPLPLSVDADAANPVVIAVNAATLNTLRVARSWAQQNMAILITGETGTGKDLLARYIHAISPRRDRPFVALDLNAIPETLWESELFGYRRGSFTGAVEEKTGLLESAAGGTVFLNEVGNLPIGMQTKLLEFLDTRQVRRLGDMQTLTIDVRIIAATNRPLVAAVDEGTFRSDLYFRLEQAPLELLPLRERRDDILPLVRHFLGSFGVPAEVRERVPDQAWFAMLVSRPWRGNIRELRNFLWQLVTLTGPRLDFEFDLWLGHLMAHASGSGNGHGNGNGSGNGNGAAYSDGIGITRSAILKTLKRRDWNQRAAARDLEMSEANVRYLIRRLKIERPFELEHVG